MAGLPLPCAYYSWLCPASVLQCIWHVHLHWMQDVKCILKTSLQEAGGSDEAIQLAVALAHERMLAAEFAESQQAAAPAQVCA